MKKVSIIAIAVLATLSSCSLSSYQCHTYGNTNMHTKHGSKAQVKYEKKHRI